MRILAIIANIVMLGFVWVTMQKWGLNDTEDKLMFFLPISTAVLSLIALIFPGKGWLALYFKRRAVEEKKKIEELEAGKQ